MDTKRPVIKIFGAIDETTVRALAKAIDEQVVKPGVSEFTLLISSVGGSVYWGLSAYHYLKGIPARVVTHNFGMVDSIALPLYCSGDVRLSVPQARFHMHAVSWNFGGPVVEVQLEEALKLLRADESNIAKVIAATSGTKSDIDVLKAMKTTTTLMPEEAKDPWRLVHEIRSELFDSSAEIIAVP